MLFPRTREVESVVAEEPGVRGDSGRIVVLFGEGFTSDDTFAGARTEICRSLPASDKAGSF